MTGAPTAAMGEMSPRLHSVECAAVLGLGLMGGSIARELAARGVRVLGFDRDPAATAAARVEGVLHEVLDPSLKGLAEASLVICAVPVDAAAELLVRAAPHLRERCVITDLGSTKRSICAAMESAGLGARFVGSHPLAGDHRAGWSASRPGMFLRARVFLCPAPSATGEAIRRVQTLWTALGAVPETLDADEHDRRLAWTSHLPQAIASTLAFTLHAAGVPRHELGPGGRDTTRLAASRPEIWTAIARENAANLAEAISAFESQLRSLRQAVEHHDVEALDRLFTGAGCWSSSATPPPERAAGR